MKLIFPNFLQFSLTGLPLAELSPCNSSLPLRIAGSAGDDGADQRAAGGLNVVVAVAGAVLTGKTREIKDNVIYWCIVKVKLQSPVVLEPLLSSINYNLTERATTGEWESKVSKERSTIIRADIERAIKSRSGHLNCIKTYYF